MTLKTLVHVHKLQTNKLWSILGNGQTFLENQWPLPYSGSTLNLSIRDVIYTVLLAYVSKYLYWICILGLVIYEPAFLIFPYNVAHSLLVHSPRFWNYKAVEPKLAYFLDYLPQLQAEALSVAPHATLFSDQLHQRRIASGQPWTVFPFTSYGTINYTNCALCPTLASLILQIPSIKLSMLSIMEENTFIPTHCGYFKNVLRCHITLHVDNPETESHKRYISVAGQEHHWTPGDLVVFDDTYPHKVINQVKGRRIVLFLDVERPYVTRVATWINKAFLTILQKSKTIAQAAKVQEQNALKSRT